MLTGLLSLAILGWLGAQVVYSVDKTQFVVITRFGEITEVHASPGLNFKVPFIDTVHRLDNRVLRVDLPPTSMPDVDNQFLEMDASVRYQITDPRKFLRTLRNEVSAASPIGRILIAALRNEVGLRTLPEITGERLVNFPSEPLFEDDYLRDAGFQNYTVHPDGRFLMIQAVGEADEPRVVLIQNWRAKVLEMFSEGP